MLHLIGTMYVVFCVGTVTLALIIVISNRIRIRKDE
jgi:hypothetical protein